MNALLYSLVVVIWGTTWIAIFLQQGPVAAPVSIFWRFALATTVMMLVLLARRKLRALSRRLERRFALARVGSVEPALTLAAAGAGGGTEALTGRFLTEQKPNRRSVTFIPVEGIPALKEPGVYIAVMSQPNRFRHEFQTSISNRFPEAYPLSSLGMEGEP